MSKAIIGFASVCQTSPIPNAISTL